jgi:hypothetical protein
MSDIVRPRAILVAGILTVRRQLDQRAVLDATARHFGLVMVLTIDGARWDIGPESTTTRRSRGAPAPTL